MSSINNKSADELLMRRKIADHMLVTKIPYYTQVERASHRLWTEADEKSKGLNACKKKSEEYLCTTVYLAAMGCDLRSLEVILDLAEALRLKNGNGAVPKAKTIKSLASKMKRLAQEIRAVESTHFLTILNQQETTKWQAETRLGPEDIDDLSLTFPFMAIPKWLERRASIYDDWSDLVSQNIPPKGLNFARLGRACVAMYVKYATGRPYFAEVSMLLERRDFGRFTPTQLSRELKEFESGYHWSCEYLKLQFHQLHPPSLKPRGELVIGGISEEVLKSSKLFKYCVPRGDSVYDVKSPIARKRNTNATEKCKGACRRYRQKPESRM